MSEWEYMKVDLNNAARKEDDINVLNRFGKDGWDLVAVTSNNMAYLKKIVPGTEPQRPTTRRRTAAGE